MKAVHRDAKGKFATAMYRCEADEPFTEEQIENIFPRAWGVSVTAADRTVNYGRVRWLMMIANTSQTTGSDIRSRLEKRGAVNPTVEIIMAVPSRGQATRIGTPRTGTRRIRSNTPVGKGVVAR